jgi:hypothetical protein
MQLTAETAEIAEVKKNCLKIFSAFLRELGGELFSFIFRSDRPSAGGTPETRSNN